MSKGSRRAIKNSERNTPVKKSIRMRKDSQARAVEREQRDEARERA